MTGQRDSQRLRDGAAFPMSFAQRRLWFLHALDPTGFAHSTGRCFTVRGPLDVAALQAAVAALVARHEPLRTTFSVDLAAGSHDLLQWIHAAGQVPILVIDLPAAAVDGPAVLGHACALMEVPFDLARGPLIRVWVLRRSPDTHHVVLSVHLLAADGHGQQILCRELAAAYRAAVTGEPSGLPELPVQYADWAAWQADQLSEDRRETLLAWWRDELSDTPWTLDMARRRGARRQPRRPGHRIHRAMDPGTAAAVVSLAAREQQTLFSVLAAACGAVLGSYSGQDRLLVGVAVANREPAEIDHVLGFFVDSVALRIDLTGDPSFAELVRRVSRTTRRAWEHHDLPFDQLVAALRPPRDPLRSPIVQVNFAYHPAGSTGALSLHGCTVTEEPVDARTVKFELTLRVEQTADGNTLLWAEFDPDAFDDEFVERLLADYHELLATAVASPGQRISELTRATPTEALVAGLFADTLGRTRVTAHDEFFALGGQSLQLIELMNRITARTGEVIALPELYRTASVAEIAALIDRRRRSR